VVRKERERICQGKKNLKKKKGGRKGVLVEGKWRNDCYEKGGGYAQSTVPDHDLGRKRVVDGAQRKKVGKVWKGEWGRGKKDP